MFYLEFHFLFDISGEVFDLDTLLLHCISVTNGNAAVLDGVKVISYAERSTDLVLSSVTLADRACFVVVNAELLSEHIVNLASLLCEFL